MGIKGSPQFGSVGFGGDIMYYLLRADGSSVFSLPYDKEFLIHCLIVLSNREIDTTGYRLMSSSILTPQNTPLTLVSLFL